MIHSIPDETCRLRNVKFAIHIKLNCTARPNRNTRWR